MIAVGTHKTGFIHGKVFGSRSLQLAAAAHSPVAIVPQTSRRDGQGIVVGIDESERAVRPSDSPPQRRSGQVSL